MKASVAKATFSRVVQVVALGGVGVVGAWLVGWLVGWLGKLSHLAPLWSHKLSLNFY